MKWFEKLFKKPDEKREEMVAHLSVKIYQDKIAKARGSLESLNPNQHAARNTIMDYIDLLEDSLEQYKKNNQYVGGTSNDKDSTARR